MFYCKESHTQNEQQSALIPWTRQELAALVQYIALYHDATCSTSVWPVHKRTTFWDGCASAISDVTKCPLRTGKINQI
jgi:hypothetical protein